MNIKHINKKLLIPLVALSLIIAGASTYFMLNRSENRSDSDTTQNEHDKTKTNDTTETDDQPIKTPVDEQISDFDEKMNPGSTPKKTEVTPVITQLEQSGPGEPLVVKAFIPDSGPGTCTLKMTQDSLVYTAKNETEHQTSYYSCKGFSVPVSELPGKGTWIVIIEFSSEQQSGASSAQNITIE